MKSYENFASAGSGSAPTGMAAMMEVRFPRRDKHGVLKTFLYGLKCHFWRVCEQKLLFRGGDHLDVIGSK